VIAEALAAVTLTRGPVAESVTQRSAVISFRTSAPDHDSVVLQGGAPIDAGTGVDHGGFRAGAVRRVKWPVRARDYWQRRVSATRAVALLHRLSG